LLVSAAAVGLQYHWHRDEVSRFTRFELPAFDPYVYVAMAEHPRVFTVAPWGYRILTPWVVHALPAHSAVQGFRIVTLTGLAATGLLLFVFLRRVGHGEWPSLLGVALFSLSGPIGECVQSIFVAEPLSLLLLVGFLWAVAAEARPALLVLLTVLLSYSKEVWPFLLPLVFLSQQRAGWRRALGVTLAVAAAALLASQSVRSGWVPHVQAPHAPWNLASARVGWQALVASWPETWPALVLGGLTPAAALGALTPRGRPFARRYGYLALALVALALGAWMYVPAPVPVPLYGGNTLRLMSYPLPLLLSLALFALDAVWPHWRPPSGGVAVPRPVTLAVGALALLALIVPPVLLDPYRRVPLHHYRDGPLVLTLCRESLKTARRLQAGRETSWSLSGPTTPNEPGQPVEMPRLRWFLREGWGPEPHTATGEAVMHATEAALLLPCFEPRPLELRLAMASASPRPVRVAINGHDIGAFTASSDGEAARLRIPATALFRGDNRVTLLTTEAGVVRLQELSYRPAD
jgi:hypothetical protein